MTITYEAVSIAPTSRATEPLADEQEERSRLDQMIECAATLDEIQDATEALRTWVARHPELPSRFEGIFEHLFLREEGAREALDEAEAMGLSPDEITQRERVAALRRRVRAEDSVEVFEPALQQARKALDTWQAVHPEDPQIPHLRNGLDQEAEMACALHEMA